MWGQLVRSGLGWSVVNLGGTWEYSGSFPTHSTKAAKIVVPCPLGNNTFGYMCFLRAPCQVRLQRNRQEAHSFRAPSILTQASTKANSDVGFSNFTGHLRSVEHWGLSAFQFCGVLFSLPLLLDPLGCSLDFRALTIRTLQGFGHATVLPHDPPMIRRVLSLAAVILSNCSIFSDQSRIFLGGR